MSQIPKISLTPTSPAIPWYHPVGNELEVFHHCARTGLPLMLKGPTGCGKSRLVEHMAAKLGRNLITVACHDETSAVDLVGRYLVEGGQTRWQDGPVTRAVREGAILYLDEIAEARPDVVVVIHPLTDHRRCLMVERHNEEIPAAPGFLLVVSFNPGYQKGLKELRPSTRQRFVGLSFTYPSPAVEQAILLGETGLNVADAKKLITLAGKLRGMENVGMAEVPSTRLLVNAARLLNSGIPPRLACEVALVEPLTDEPELARAINDLISLIF